MPDLRPVELHVLGDLASVAEAAAAEAAAGARAAAARGSCSIALSGGNTPRPLHERLARMDLPWERVHLFWGDERYVPHDSAESNYRMARETLINRISIPPGNVHPMPTDRPDPDQAARDYEAELRAYFGSSPPRFDLVLLGLGEDGHTASLFSGAAALQERERLVMPSLAPAEPRQRLTLTYPVINNAARVFFMVAGEEKAEAVRRALTADEPLERTPAAGVRPHDGRLAWWLDEAAASLLDLDAREGKTR